MLNLVRLSPARSAVQEHGGDLAAVRAAYPKAPRPWLDLSTGINPWAYPAGTKWPAAWQGLPGAADETAVREAAAAYYGVAPDEVVSAPGSQAVIQWLPRLRRPGSVAVLGPTYNEHAASWRVAGHDV